MSKVRKIIIFIRINYIYTLKYDEVILIIFDF